MMGDFSEEDSCSSSTWAAGVHHGWIYEYCRYLERAGEEAALRALSRMTNNRKYSDLVFVCKDGVQKYGSRSWLSARCSELEKRIRNGTTTESGHTLVSLPSTGPAAMLLVLEYLHTGSEGARAILRRLDPRTLRIISGDVIRTARRLRLPRLESYVRMMSPADDPRVNHEEELEEEEQETEKELIFDALSRMLKIPRYSDVLIESRDGVLAPASRLWLDARCPVLGRMFKDRRGGLREKILLNLSTEVVYVVLDYIYTGSPRGSVQMLEERKRWNTCLEGVCAARYLEIPHLEKILWSLLMIDVYRSISTSDYDESTRDMIELSVFRFSQLRNFPFEFLSGGSGMMNPVEHARNVEMLATDLVRIIDLGPMDTHCLRHFSREDLTYFLMKSQRRSSGRGEIPYRLEEYLRVRSIVVWCVWEHSRAIYLSPELVSKLVSVFFSKAEFARALHYSDCTEREREESYRSLHRQRRKIAQAKTTRRILKLVCNIAKFEESFLPYVNLELIHPDILINLLQPWRLIPSSLIKQALRTQALQACQLSYHVSFENQLTPNW